MKGAVKLKKETYRSWRTYGTPEAADSYQQAKQSAAWVVIDKRIQVWEKFGEAVEPNFQLVLKKFCLSVCRFRREKGTPSTWSSM